MIELFPDQQRTIAAVRASYAAGHQSTVMVSPTGSGKTVMFSWLADKLRAAAKRVTILDHRDELTEQICATLDKFRVQHGVITSGTTYSDPRVAVQVASVFTLVRRLERLPVPDYAIIDEAHHCIAGSTWGKVIEFWRARNPKLRLLGVTATPERLGGEGLGQIFSDMVIGPTTAELIALGRLAPYKLFAPPPDQQADLDGMRSRGGDFTRDEAAGRMDKPTITGNAVAHYRKHCNGAPAVAFCSSIAHAEHVAEAFRAQGFRAASIDGKMSKDDRKQRVRDFGAGQLNVLTSCDLISEGFDVPGIVGAIELRPTESLALCLQQRGRALRMAPGKSHAVILDHVGNSMRHGLPDDEREWSLEGCKRKSKKERDPDDLPVKQCMTCYAVNKALVQKCRACGAPFVVKARKVAEVEGELAEVDTEAFRAAREARAEQARAKTVADLVRNMGYSEGRAQHIVEAREEKERLRSEVMRLSLAADANPLDDRFVRALKPKQLRELIEQYQAMEAA